MTLRKRPAEVMVLDFRRVNGPIDNMTDKQKKRLKKLMAQARIARAKLDKEPVHRCYLRIRRNGRYGNFRHREVRCITCGYLEEAESRVEGRAAAAEHEKMWADG